jgi:hypothetical protein
MSSSSTGTTHLEISLVAHFRRVYVHLHLSACRAELDYLLTTFTSLLDLSSTRLQLALRPGSLPLQERAKARADVEAMASLGCASKAMKRCERILQAGYACGDMGWLLKRVGRTKEGEQWCEFDRLLEVLAWEVKGREDAKAALVAAEEKRRARARSRSSMRSDGPDPCIHRHQVIEID